MPKLYYTPVSCGAASFISCVAAGVHFDCEQVCLDSHKTATDVDFYTINPKGNVPCLVLDDGTILNENVSVLMFIADQNPGSVAPERGTSESYVLENILSFLATEVLATFKEIFLGHNGDIKQDHLNMLGKKFAYIEKFLLHGKKYLVGDKFSVADAYLYVMLHWDVKAGIDLGPFPELLAFREHIDGLQEVVAAKQKMETHPTSV